MSRAEPGGSRSMSPRPRSCSAPFPSRMVRESTLEATRNAIRAGKFALMMPVMTWTDGLWAAGTRGMAGGRHLREVGHVGRAGDGLPQSEGEPRRAPLELLGLEELAEPDGLANAVRDLDPHGGFSRDALDKDPPR